MEKSKRQLSRAEVYGESVLEQMRKKPGDCDVYKTLVPYIGNNPLIVFAGVGGGSMNVAMDYLKKLQNIHKPHCRLHEKPPEQVLITHSSGQ